jgi:glutathione S-transferase
MSGEYCTDARCYELAPCSVHQKIKLIYFNSKGRAETARLILAETKTEYEDYRFPLNADNDTNPQRMNDAFAALEPKLTWGQVPAIEVGNTLVTQSRAIERYLAKRTGLMPRDPVEAALADGVVEACNDLLNDFIKTVFGKPEEKEAALKEFKENSIPRYAKMFSAVLESNGTGYYGKNFSYADIIAYYQWDLVNNFTGGQLLEGYPAIKKHVELVASRPNIKAWLESRPKTQY